MDLTRMIPTAVAIVVVWAAGVALGYIDALGLGPLSVAVFTIGALTFFSVLRAGGDMRTAIAATFVVLYVALLAALATSERNRAQLDNVVGEEVWQNFTYLVGVIVVFYFGSTAAVEITQHIQGTADPASVQHTASGDPSAADSASTSPPS